jgi:hypothetical protein
MTTTRRALPFVALILLLGAAGLLQARLEARLPIDPLEVGTLYFRSPKFVDRAVLSYDSLVADVYWMRVIQHYGGQRRSESAEKRYDLVYPLLDLTTSLDPYFTAAYYYGSFFLAEPLPSGAGQPDLAVTLLTRGVEYQPQSWRLIQQLGFIHYWYRHDFTEAADWFGRAAKVPGAPAWLTALEATTRAEGGDIAASRRLWQQLMETAETDFMRETAQFRLMQVDAQAAINELHEIVSGYALAHGHPPSSWEDLIRDRRLPGMPLDPTGTPFVIGDFGKVDVSPQSRIYPLPVSPVRSGS